MVPQPPAPAYASGPAAPPGPVDAYNSASRGPIARDVRPAAACRTVAPIDRLERSLSVKTSLAMSLGLSVAFLSPASAHAYDQTTLDKAAPLIRQSCPAAVPYDIRIDAKGTIDLRHAGDAASTQPVHLDVGESRDLDTYVADKLAQFDDASARSCLAPHLRTIAGLLAGQVAEQKRAWHGRDCSVVATCLPADEVASRIHAQVCESDAAACDRDDIRRRLLDGQPVSSIVRDLVSSKRYYDAFPFEGSGVAGLVAFYKHVLGRAPIGAEDRENPMNEAKDVLDWHRDHGKDGHLAPVFDRFMKSEYGACFRDDDVPVARTAGPGTYYTIAYCRPAAAR
jgi:hypothetical protein